MRYRYMDNGKLVATLSRIGNGRPGSPVCWLLQWSGGKDKDRKYKDQWDAMAKVRHVYPHATREVIFGEKT